MRVLIYEHLTAQGIGREPGSPEHSLYREGKAMRDAVAADFEQLDDCEVEVFPDTAWSASPQAMVVLAAGCDLALVIAPELEGILAERVEVLRAEGCRVLASAGPTLGLTSDKLALAEHWRERGIPTPATSDRAPTACEAFPVVWKPRHGAGSTATTLLRSALDLPRAELARQAELPSGEMILQEFVPGRAASVAFLCGPRGNVPLLPSFQLLDGLKYCGGELPMPHDLADRAIRLTQRAVDCVPGLLGYVGVDLVLGEAADGSRDYAIEVNPRLTTSYVGLRALAGFNLAGAMIQAATGDLRVPLNWKSGKVRFRPDGIVETG